MTPKARILVVDDHPTSRLKVVMAVRALGHETRDAENGRAALEALREDECDLVLLDLLMPEMDGYAVLSAIRDDPDLRSIPVIVISSVDELDSVLRAIKLGAEDYLPKDFDPLLLEARVAASLAKKRLRDLELEYMKQVEIERSRADAILHSTLPAAAVHELKTTNTFRPRRFENVVVLFADVVGFTAYCDSHPVDLVVEQLQEFVAEFETLADRNGLEKIKTIGDAFMATGGLLKYTPEPVHAAARCGLEMVETAPRLSSGWSVRVGIHLGSVVAGIIGQQQFLFDVWGDTVNIASRIVEQAAPGTVLLSGFAWRQLGKRATGVSHGIADLKGKGATELVECRGLRSSSGP